MAGKTFFDSAASVAVASSEVFQPSAIKARVGIAGSPKPVQMTSGGIR